MLSILCMITIAEGQHISKTTQQSLRQNHCTSCIRSTTQTVCRYLALILATLRTWMLPMSQPSRQSYPKSSKRLSSRIAAEESTLHRIISCYHPSLRCEEDNNNNNTNSCNSSLPYRANPRWSCSIRQWRHRRKSSTASQSSWNKTVQWGLAWRAWSATLTKRC